MSWLLHEFLHKESTIAKSRKGLRERPGVVLFQLLPREKGIPQLDTPSSTKALLSPAGDDPQHFCPTRGQERTLLKDCIIWGNLVSPGQRFCHRQILSTENHPSISFVGASDTNMDGLPCHSLPGHSFFPKFKAPHAEPHALPHSCAQLSCLVLLHHKQP